MSFFDVFKRRIRPEPAGAQERDALLDQIAVAFPRGPVRRGSLRGVPRAHDLTDKAPVIDEIMIFDAEDHWLFLFLGCRPLGLRFELSMRIARSPGDAPPQWCIEPVTRVANAVGDGARCEPGVTWRLGSPIGGAASPFVGFVTLPDLQFGNTSPDRVLQLVPVTQAELDAAGPELVEMRRRLEGDRSRMLGVLR